MPSGWVKQRASIPGTYLLDRESKAGPQLKQHATTGDLVDWRHRHGPGRPGRPNVRKHARAAGEFDIGLEMTEGSVGSLQPIPINLL